MGDDVALEMKIKSLTRAPPPPGDGAMRQPRNLDPSHHPFERAREYTRALNAVKMERMFAAPFVGQLGGGHVDGVYSMAKDPGSLRDSQAAVAMAWSKSGT